MALSAMEAAKGGNVRGAVRSASSGRNRSVQSRHKAVTVIPKRQTVSRKTKRG